jgi:hypothetical protein
LVFQAVNHPEVLLEEEEEHMEEQEWKAVVHVDARVEYFGEPLVDLNQETI